MIRTGISLCLCLLLTGCSFLGFGRLTSEAPHISGKPIVYIYPMSDVYKQASTGVMAFQVPSNMNSEQGVAVATLFKDVLLGKRAYKRVRLLPKQYSDLQDALEAGKKADVDLVVAGSVNYAMAGTELGGARVDVSVRVMNVRTGNTVWHMGQTMDQPLRYPDTGLVDRFVDALNPSEIKKPQGAPAVPNMLAQIASDMADVMGAPPVGM